MSKTIGIVGSRRRNSQKDFSKVLEIFKRVYEEGDRICSGGCSQGGDAFANVIAQDTGIPILIFYPAWGKYGYGAGFIRNGLIAQASDVLIACVAENREGGTEDTIKKFEGYPGKHAILC